MLTARPAAVACRHWRALGLSSCIALALASPGASWADTATHGGTSGGAASPADTDPTQAWRPANEAVGQYPRGHADILRAERQRAAPPAAASATAPTAPLTASAPVLGLAEAQRQALAARPDLLAVPGLSAAERLALQRSARALALEVERAWIDAVAAQLAVAQRAEVLAAAEAGAELAQRMRRVGNWSSARRIQEELLLWDARARHLAAMQAASQARMALWRLGVGALPAPAVDRGDTVDGTLASQGNPAANSGNAALAAHATMASDPAYALPDRLPPLPDPVAAPGSPEAQALEARALAMHGEWPTRQLQLQRLLTGLTSAERQRLDGAMASLLDARPAGRGLAERDPRREPWSEAFEHALAARAEAQALERRIRGDVRDALGAYLASHARAQQARGPVRRLYAELRQETLLRYNGMLKSSWDLLAAARAASTSVEAALEAERQAWQAHADLMGVLDGLPWPGGVGAGRADPGNGDLGAAAGAH